jgi:Domain of unknown function (DUF4124)
MKNRQFLLALAGSIVLACTGTWAATGKGTRAYRWVDKDGVVHFGDTVPPEYSEQAHQELNQQGVPVREFPRQLSPEEAAAARKADAEQARRQQHDSFLLNTYTKVGDIEQLRDERIALINSQMELARGSIAATDQRLTALENRLRAFRPYSDSRTARRVPDQLAEEVVRALSERRSMDTQLQQRAREKAEQVANFEEDIARYKELTVSRSGR